MIVSSKSLYLSTQNKADYTVSLLTVALWACYALALLKAILVNLHIYISIYLLLETSPCLQTTIIHMLLESLAKLPNFHSTSRESSST